MKYISYFSPSPLERAGVRLLLLIALWCLSSCDRRKLAYESQDDIPFHISVDWSALPQGAEKPQYVRALFFPVDGGEVIERYLSDDGKEVLVPPGEYRIIVYNWRTNAETQTVQFRGDTYDTFRAYTAPRSATLRTRGERELFILPQPDTQLYGWNTGEETVTISVLSPVVRTRASAGNTLHISMRALVHSYTFAIHVENAGYISSISAMTTDAHGALPLGGGDYEDGRYAVETEIEQGESGGGLTTYYCRVTTFGLFDDVEKRLVVNITNTGGNAQQTEAEITAAVGNVDRGEIAPQTPQVVISGEKPIVVETPVMEGGGFAPPSLDDWEENETEIPLL